MNKIKLALVSAGASLATLMTFGIAKADTLTTTTLGTAIDSVSSNWYDMFLVFLSHAWPFILGATVLGGIVGLALYLIHKLFGGGKKR